mmetsp:Transcript_21723/g.63932  ORF Transcript_21723/g.63932 Transcript_21723/m.63932 type:complete len:432 (+) Transcript_21723:1579-2874(+)
MERLLLLLLLCLFLPLFLLLVGVVLFGQVLLLLVSKGFHVVQVEEAVVHVQRGGIVQIFVVVAIGAAAGGGTTLGDLFGAARSGIFAHLVVVAVLLLLRNVFVVAAALGVGHGPRHALPQSSGVLILVLVLVPIVFVFVAAPPAFHLLVVRTRTRRPVLLAAPLVFVLVQPAQVEQPDAIVRLLAVSPRRLLVLLGQSPHPLPQSTDEGVVLNVHLSPHGLGVGRCICIAILVPGGADKQLGQPRQRTRIVLVGLPAVSLSVRSFSSIFGPRVQRVLERREPLRLGEEGAGGRAEDGAEVLRIRRVGRRRRRRRRSAEERPQRVLRGREGRQQSREGGRHRIGPLGVGLAVVVVVGAAPDRQIGRGRRGPHGPSGNVAFLLSLSLSRGIAADGEGIVVGGGGIPRIVLRVSLRGGRVVVRVLPPEEGGEEE